MKRIKKIGVVTFILLKDDKMLVEKRRDDKRTYPNKITLPGGGVLPKESIGHALKREIKEELGVSALKYKYIGTLLENTQNIEFELHFFAVPKWKGRIINKEAKKVFWIGIDEYRKLAPLNHRLIIESLLDLNK